MHFSQGNRGARGPRRGSIHARIAWLAPLTLVVAGCGGGDSEESSFDKVTTVEVLRVEPERLRDTVKFGGQLGSEKSVQLMSELEGILATVEFAEGQRVAAGDVLFRLRSDEQAARLKEAEANLALARSEAGRAEKLLSKNAGAQAARDRAKAELGVALARVELARVALSQTTVRAPFDGVMGIRMVDPGDYVTDKVTLGRIDAVDRLQATFAMSEIALPFARVGIPVEILVAPYPGERFPGKVFFVSPTLDEATRRIIVKAWVPNDHGKLAAGLYANVEVEIRSQDNSILVPESAVVADRLGTFVWSVADDDVASRVNVEIGLRQAGRVEITRGLSGGERIVTAGTHKVSDGKAVSVAPAPVSGTARVPTKERAGEGT
jgi:membrane fusion protein (multidrug efflux system)